MDDRNDLIEAQRKIIQELQRKINLAFIQDLPALSAALKDAIAGLQMLSASSSDRQQGS